MLRAIMNVFTRKKLPTKPAADFNGGEQILVEGEWKTLHSIERGDGYIGGGCLKTARVMLARLEDGTEIPLHPHQQVVYRQQQLN